MVEVLISIIDDDDSVRAALASLVRSLGFNLRPTAPRRIFFSPEEAIARIALSRICRCRVSRELN